jgi:hypothetical protein
MAKTFPPNCLICGDESRYYFSKRYGGFPCSPFPEGFDAHLYKCVNCGFTLSNTHFEMNEHDWYRLNETWHHYHESDNQVNQPPYINMALALKLLMEKGIISKKSVLDYAAGYGTLSDLLLRYFDIPIEIFDDYVNDAKKRYLKKSDLLSYKVVINTAMFEHIVKRSSLDEVNKLVDEDGVLMLHTMVAETVPNDADWFYLVPHVHTAFHTNKSMSILMRQWGYSSSVYAPEARSWFWFKENSPHLGLLEAQIETINWELKRKFFIWKDDFVDFWK